MKALSPGLHTVNKVLRRAQEDGWPRFRISHLQAHLMPLLTNLFGALRKPESEENEYLMKAVTRVITFVGPEVWALCMRACAGPHWLPRRRIMSVHSSTCTCASCLGCKRATCVRTLRSLQRRSPGVAARRSVRGARERLDDSARALERGTNLPASWRCPWRQGWCPVTVTLNHEP